MIRLARFQQNFPRPVVSDLEGEIRRQLDRLLLADLVGSGARLGSGSCLGAGARVCIPAGSRGIANIPVILRIAVQYLKEAGFSPFLVAAMGSHGGGTAEGQRRILAELGITEESTGAPLLVTDRVVEVGRTPSDRPIYCDQHAAGADGILLINRVKPHTAFRGRIESGLWKMMAVGLGKVLGATQVHRLGAEGIGEAILELGRGFMDNLPVLGGLAIVENGYEETAAIHGLRPDEFEREEEILVEARSLLPGLPVGDIDLLIVDQMGKNFSGTGMDVNVVGRWRIQGMLDPERPMIKRLVVLDLSPETEGNANGIGLADITTRELVNKIDFRATYLNCLTTTFFMRAAVPMTMDSDREAIEAALRSLGPDAGEATDTGARYPEEEVRAIRIKNTLQLDEIWASPALEGELLAAGCGRIGPYEPMIYDDGGNLTPRTNQD